MTRSGSGSMTFDEAEDRPFETIMSGPVAGAEGSGELSRRLNNINLVLAKECQPYYEFLTSKSIKV